jgi:hypothetical protein
MTLRYATFAASCLIAALAGTWSSVHAGPETTARHAGRIQAVSPNTDVLVIEGYGSSQQSELLEVRIRRAEIVRVWRDAADPGAWRQRATTIYRWPVGTFVVILGIEDESGVIEASRVEIPKATFE